MESTAITVRYNQLAESDCCLSCGGAINWASPEEGEVCVDLGSGRGTDVLKMAGEVGTKGFVYGIDISDGMLTKARQMASRFEITNVEFIQSDLTRIALPDETADLIISNCTINHASEKTAVWNEIFRILKKKGRFVISDIYSVDPIPPEYSQDPAAVAECWAGAIPKEEYLQILDSLGFKEIAILEESKPYLKGKAEVASFTIAGKKSTGCGCKK